MSHSSQNQQFKNIPANLDISQLTNEELEQLSKVLKKHEQLENKYDRVISPNLLLSPSPTHSLTEKESLKSISQDSASSLNTNSNNNNNNKVGLSSKFSFPFKTSNNSITSKKSLESTSLINRIASFKSLRSFIDNNKKSNNSINGNNHVQSNDDKSQSKNMESIQEANYKVSYSSPSSPLKRNSYLNYCFICRLSFYSNSNDKNKNELSLIKCIDCSNLICNKCYFNQESKSDATNDLTTNKSWKCKICIIKKNEQSKNSSTILGAFSLSKIINNISSKMNHSSPTEQFLKYENKKNNNDNSYSISSLNKRDYSSSPNTKDQKGIYSSPSINMEIQSTLPKTVNSHPTLQAYRSSPIAKSIQERRLSKSNDIMKKSCSRKESLPANALFKSETNQPSNIKVVSITEINKFIENNSKLNDTKPKKKVLRQMSSVDSSNYKVKNTTDNQLEVKKDKGRRFSLNFGYRKSSKRPALQPQKSIDIPANQVNNLCDAISEEKGSNVVINKTTKVEKDNNSNNSGNNEKNIIKINDTKLENYQSKREKSFEKNKKKKNFKRSFSNDPKSNKDQKKLYLQRQSVDKITDKQILENLADLAKVILIEHKRSIIKQIKVEDSFTTDSNSANQSRQDTLSSHKESNSSVNEGELVRRAAKEMSVRNNIKPSDVIGKSKSRREFLSSEKLHKRRIDLMRKSKKWSNAVDETDDVANASMTTSSMNSNLELQGACSHSNSTNYDDSMCTSLPTAYGNDDDDESCRFSYNNSENSSKHKLDEMSYYNCNYSNTTTNYFTNFVHTNIDHNQIAQISINSTETQHVIKRLPSRKLPEIPKSSSKNNDSYGSITSSNNKSEEKNTSQNSINSFNNNNSSNNNNSNNSINTFTNPPLGNERILEKSEESDRLIIDVGCSTTVVKQKLNKTKSKSLDSSKTASELQSPNSPVTRDNSIKHKNKDNRLNFSSVDVNIASFFEKRNLNIFDSIPSSQRSIDYPYIVRKNHPNLSDIVRKRLLFEKINHKMSLFGEAFSNSIEKDHVPKQQRTIVIRKDNSIEIKLRRPPKIRNQTASLDLLNITTFSTLVAAETRNEPNSKNELQVALAVKNPSMLSVVSSASSDINRRKTIETCENIFNQSEETTKLRAKSSPTNPHRILLYKDKSDRYVRTNGLGMIIIGGHECEDGSLGCFVSMVQKAGPADINNIEVGDQILEFNGHSLIDSTYEEVRALQNYSVDYVQLVVHHNNIIYKNSPTNNSLQVSRNFQTLPRLCQSLTNRRRNLPPLPMPPSMQNKSNFPNQNQFKKEFSVAETLFVPSKNSLLKPILINRGRLLMQLWDDSVKSKLAITINHANNLPPRSESEKWYTFMIGRLIYDDETIHKFKTTPILADTQSWNETFVFEYTNLLEEVFLEITVYDTLSNEDSRPLRENFIGMIVLPLNEANLEDEPRWYELRDKQSRKNSNASVTFKSSSNDESQDSLCEKKRKIINIISGKHMSRKSTIINKSSDSRETGGSQGRSLSKKRSVRKLSQAIARLFTRRNSDTCVKKEIIDAESEQNDQDENEKVMVYRNSKRNRQRRHTELLGVNFLLPSSSGTSRRTSNTSNEDMDRYFSTQENIKLNDPKVNGLGQITPKGDYKENVVTGCIKIGFVMSKGQLEIFVFEARNLKNGPYKELYIKTYLRTGTQKINKKKTHILRNTTEPVFNTKLCYKACNVLGRRIQIVLISEKGKQDTNCVGEAFIQLDCLDLSQQSISWYKLYKQSVVENDFFDSA